MSAAPELRDTQRCVMCGLCLPHCPTYVKTRDEGDSPRGRIALIQALDQRQLEPSTRLRFHLDRCLGCGACEAMCPSQVPYLRLLDAARGSLAESDPANNAVSRLALDALLQGRRPMAFATGLLRLYQRSGLQWLAQRSGLLSGLNLQRADAMLPPLPPRERWRTCYPAVGREQGRVALFTGCIAPLADPATLRDAIKVLTRCGFAVHIPPEQTCCGALHQHQGQRDTAARLAGKNVAAFGALENMDAIVTAASGCGAHLAQYGEPSLAPGAAATFTSKLQDINEFLGGEDRMSRLPLVQTPLRVAVHRPCTLTRKAPGGADPLSWLRNVSGIEWLSLAEAPHCCGAAGTYFLSQADMADDLLGDQLAVIRRLRPDLVVTANIGCWLHLRAGLRRHGLAVEVIHPVSLLARRLG